MQGPCPRVCPAAALCHPAPRYLLPCSHVMLSQKRAVRDLDIYGKTAAKFLSLIPRCCRPESPPLPRDRDEEPPSRARGMPCSPSGPSRAQLGAEPHPTIIPLAHTEPSPSIPAAPRTPFLPWLGTELSLWPLRPCPPPGLMQSPLLGSLWLLVTHPCSSLLTSPSCAIPTAAPIPWPHPVPLLSSALLSPWTPSHLSAEPLAPFLG